MCVCVCVCIIRASVDALSRDGTDMRGDAQNPKKLPSSANVKT